MPSPTVVIILAIAGALCQALMAAARRWPEGGRWNGRSQGLRDEALEAYMQRLTLQQVLLRILRARSGELPPAVVTRVESAGPEWCEEMLNRAVTARSLEEMGF